MWVKPTNEDMKWKPALPHSCDARSNYRTTEVSWVDTDIATSTSKTKIVLKYRGDWFPTTFNVLDACLVSYNFRVILPVKKVDTFPDDWRLFTRRSRSSTRCLHSSDLQLFYERKLEKVKRKGRREEIREGGGGGEREAKGVKCQVMWLFVHLFMSLPAFVAGGVDEAGGRVALTERRPNYFRIIEVCLQRNNV